MRFKTLPCRSLLAFFAALFLSACASAPIALFDGETLQGWVQQGDVNWEVRAGEIIASGGEDGFIVTDAVYGDFNLRVEFWVDATTNSGIFIRCQARANIHPDTCYELNIWDMHPRQEARTGAIVFKAMPPLAQVDTVGRWNVYEAHARGRQMVVKVNGIVTANLENANPAPGFIALQHWGSGTVMFRNLELRPL